MELRGISRSLRVRKGQTRGYAVGDVCDLPDDARVGPATDGAMQPHTLLLPHSVGAWFNHKLRGMHQAVFVHALKVLLVFMDLQTEQYLSTESLRMVVPLPNLTKYKKSP